MDWRRLFLMLILVSVSATINFLIVRSVGYGFVLLFSAPLLFSSALTCVILPLVDDKSFSFGFFLMGSFVWWVMVLFFGTWLVGLFLLLIGQTAAFPLFGGLAGLGLYLLYGYFMFNHISRVAAISCFFAGVLAMFLTFGIGTIPGKLDIENPWLYFNWQMLVGIGHIFAVYLRMKLISTSTRS